MSSSRRRFLAGTTGLALATGCSRLQHELRGRVTGPLETTFVPLPADSNKLREARHVLNRLSFGPRPGDLAQVVSMGAAGWIEAQLAAQMPEDPAVGWRLNGLDTQEFVQSSGNALNSADVLNSLSDEQLLTELQQATLVRSLYSTRQLYET